VKSKPTAPRWRLNDAQTLLPSPTRHLAGNWGRGCSSYVQSVSAYDRQGWVRSFSPLITGTRAYFRHSSSVASFIRLRIMIQIDISATARVRVGRLVSPLPSCIPTLRESFVCPPIWRRRINDTDVRRRGFLENQRDHPGPQGAAWSSARPCRRRRAVSWHAHVRIIPRRGLGVGLVDYPENGAHCNLSCGRLPV